VVERGDLGRVLGSEDALPSLPGQLPVQKVPRACYLTSELGSQSEAPRPVTRRPGRLDTHCKECPGLYWQRSWQSY
jgi:hypothetical protein